MFCARNRDFGSGKSKLMERPTSSKFRRKGEFPGRVSLGQQAEWRGSQGRQKGKIKVGDIFLSFVF